MDNTKERVVAFRIPDNLASNLETKAVEPKIIGIRSGNQFARKLVIDFLAGRLVYLNPADRKRDPVVNGLTS